MDFGRQMLELPDRRKMRDCALSRLGRQSDYSKEPNSAERRHAEGPSIALIEDDEDDFLMARDLLSEIYGTRYRLEWTRDWRSALEAISNPVHDVCLVDYRLGEASGLDIVREAVARGCKTPIILLTGESNREVDLEAMKVGAFDYLCKDEINPASLERAIRYAMERHRVEMAMLSTKRDAEQAARAASDAMVKAQTSDRAKSEFLANMSHELRTPLNAILGFSEIMKKELLGPVGTTQYREYANDIFESGTHLLGVINDILDISKIETGKVQLYESEVNLQDVVDKSQRLVRGRAYEKGITFSECRSEMPMLYADERILKQCIVNLLSNAVKFTDKGGKITVRVKRRDDGDLSIVVSDTGIGIPKEDFDIVLTPFGQVESAYSGTYEGTGLGLPITKAFVELHGGSLALESTPGIGTTVTLTFPEERVVETTARRCPEGSMTQ